MEKNIFMTPKLKAIELVDKLKPYAYTNLFSFVKESNLGNAKKSALIAVDEILEILEGLNKPEYAVFDAIEKRKYAFEGEYPDHMTGYDMVSYYEEVKQEIEKL